MFMNNRVCVTGIGIVSSIGHGKEEFWNNLTSGASGITKITSFDTSVFNVHLGGEIKDFERTKINFDRHHFGRCS